MFKASQGRRPFFFSSSVLTKAEKLDFRDLGFGFLILQDLSSSMDFERINSFMAIRCPDAAVTGVMMSAQTDRFVLMWSFKSSLRFWVLVQGQ